MYFYAWGTSTIITVRLYILNIIPHISCSPNPTPAHLASTHRQQSNSMLDTGRKRERLHRVAGRLPAPALSWGWLLKSSHLGLEQPNYRQRPDTRSQLCSNARRCTVTETCTHMLIRNMCFSGGKGDPQRHNERKREGNHTLGRSRTCCWIWFPLKFSISCIYPSVTG